MQTNLGWALLGLVFLMLVPQVASAQPSGAQPSRTGASSAVSSRPNSSAAPSPTLVKAYKKYQKANDAGQYGVALKYAEKTLALGIRQYGTVHGNVVTFLGNIGDLHKETGNFRKARDIYKIALKIDRQLHGRHSAKLKLSLMNLGAVHYSMGNYARTLELYREALGYSEKALGKKHRSLSTLINNIGQVSRVVGKHKQAERFFKRALAIDLKYLGERHRKTAIDRSNLAGLYKVLGRYDEAVQLYQQAITTFENVKGLEDIETGIMLDNLGTLYLKMREYEKGKRLFNRAYRIFAKKLGKNNRHTAISMNNLGATYFYLKQFDKAARIYEKSLKVLKRHYGGKHLIVANTIDNLAGAYMSLGKLEQALPLRQQALKILTARMGELHDDTAITLNNIAELYEEMKRYDDAEMSHLSALNIRQQLYGNDHPETFSGNSSLSLFYWARKRMPLALDYARKASAGLGNYGYRNLGKVGKAYSGSAAALLDKKSYIFQNHVSIAYDVANKQGAVSGPLADETYRIAQWALRTSASAALGKMAARFSTDDPELGRLIRQRQDDILLMEKLGRVMGTLISSGSSVKRDLKTEDRLRGRITSLEHSVAEIDKALAQKFPKFANLTNPKPLSITQTQKLLKPGEGLVQFLFGKGSGYAWLVTRTGSKWVKIPHGSAYIFLQVLNLRCGLDADLWSRKGAREACLERLGKVVPKDRLEEAVRILEEDGRLPFDLRTAHTLYKDLFSGFGRELQDVRHLMVLPTGALSSLPFQVLVRQPVAGYLANESNYGKIDWMIRGHALTVLPSVSSLAALRSLKKKISAPRAYIGYGNPVLEGKPPQCPEAEVPELCESLSGNGFSLNMGKRAENEEKEKRKNILLATLQKNSRLHSLFRSSRTDVSALREQCPLPDTAYELKCVAQNIGVGQDNIFLQAEATETAVKQASKSGRLKQYRILHFATHGLLGWQAGSMIKGLAEPSLLMTPPDKASDLDDGLLSASEIARLDLNADWVILSACNTAMGNGKRLSGLSGLAKAFFYAGSRALLVSHWSVYSDAAVRLTTRALSLQKSKPGTGRAEAMRQSMLALMGNRGHYMAGHPAVWAPFIVVGEGG